MTDRKAWLTARSSGIGGSEAAVVLNLNPWKSPYALWAEKTGKIEPDDLSEVEAVEWGQLLEGPIARKFAEVTGCNFVPMAKWPFSVENEIIRHADKPWMLGTPDRVFATPDGTRGVLEIKTTGIHHAAEWKDEPPRHYQVQLQHYLAITGLSIGAFAVLIGGQRFHHCDVERNERFISHMIEKEEEFWDCVQRDIPPTVDNSASTAAALTRLYARPDEAAEPVILDFEFLEKAERLRVLKEQIKESENEAQGITNQIKAAIGGAVVGILPDGSGWSWKLQHRNSYTVEATDFRVLREVKAARGRK